MLPPPTAATDPPAPTRRGWGAGLLAAGAFALPAVALILAGHVRGRAAHDQLNFHEPVIRRFAESLPRPDLSDYLSATTPGYHLALATFARLVGDDPRALRLAGLVFSLALVGLLAWWLARRTHAPRALALAAPFACSMYVFSSGAWLLPDNAGWLGVLGVLLLALRPRVDARHLLAGGVLLVLLVLARQIHVWAAAVLWAAAWLGDAHATRTSLVSDPPARLRRAALALACSIPAFLVLAWFVRLWGGLTPPTFQNKYHGGNPAAPAFVLAIIAIYSPFFAGAVAPTLRHLWHRHRAALGACAAAGALLAIIPDTSYSTDEGRYSGLWNAVRALPLVAGRTSPLLVALSALGAVLALAFASALPFRSRWVLLAAAAAFTAAQAASHELWQRYTEPFVLMLLALASAEITAAQGGSAMPARSGPAPSGSSAGTPPAPSPSPARDPLVLGPAALALLLGLLTAWSIASARPVKPREPAAARDAAPRPAWAPPRL